MDWIHEPNPRWNADKRWIVGEAPAGVFDSRYRELDDDAPVPGEWWRVTQDGKTVAFGWLDIVWGDAEILLATSREVRGQGVGSFVLDKLEAEARSRGLNYLTNIVRPTHPDAEALTAWLTKRGFKGSEDGRLLRLVKR